MLYALGVLIFAVGLLLSIALHEVGHMVPAKKFGVKVTQYMVGFGPTAVVAQEGRHRVRPQGDPARRLHPDDRHGAAGPRRRQAVALAAPVRHRDRGLPPGQPVRGRARRRAAPVLPADPGQEDDRHARRPVHEPAHLPGAHDRSCCSPSACRRATATTTVAEVSKCVVPVTATPAAGEGLHGDQLAGRAGGPEGRRQDRLGQRHGDHSLGPAGRRSSSRRPSKPLVVVVLRKGSRRDADGHAGPQPEVRERRVAPRPRKPASSASRRQPVLLRVAVDRRRARADRPPDQASACDALGSYPQKLHSPVGHRLRGQGARPAGRGRRGRHRPHRRPDRRQPRRSARRTRCTR